MWTQHWTHGNQYDILNRLDITNRIKIYKDVQRLIADQVYMLYPFTKPVNWQFIKDYVKNYKAMPSGSYQYLRFDFPKRKEEN